MINIAKANNKERELLFREASLNSGINENIIEKDFWVSFILEHLFQKSVYKEQLIFKGGTSLSKCYNLIERFSEDVDLIVDPALVGITEEELHLDRTNTQQSKFNNYINELTNKFLINEFTPTLTKELEDLGLKDFELIIDVNDSLSVLFKYPNIHTSDYIKPVVKLEMGTLAAKVPVETKIIEPYIQTYLIELNGLYANVRTITAARTFFEKLTILHDLAHKTSNYNLRYSRHYYDTYKIITSNVFDDSLNELPLIKDVVDFKNKFYYSKRSNMEAILEGNLKLIPNNEAIIIFRKDYNEMKDMFFGEVPNYDEMLETIKLKEEMLNNKIKEYFKD